MIPTIQTGQHCTPLIHFGRSSYGNSAMDRRHRYLSWLREESRAHTTPAIHWVPPEINIPFRPHDQLDQIWWEGQRQMLEPDFQPFNFTDRHRFLMERIRADTINLICRGADVG